MAGPLEEGVPSHLASHWPCWVCPLLCHITAFLAAMEEHAPLSQGHPGTAPWLYGAQILLPTGPGGFFPTCMRSKECDH